MPIRDWLREILEGYRWLWRAQLRWRRVPAWLAAVEFGARVVEDLGWGAWAVLKRVGLSSASPVPAGITPEGRNGMAALHLGLAQGGRYDSANERLKAGFDSWLWVSMILAAVIHFSTFALWPELTAPDISQPSSVITTVDVPPPLDVPEAPEKLQAPALPVISPIELDETVTIRATTWDKNPVEALPPPPQSVATGVHRASDFTPFTVAPRVLNTDEVVRAMRREYPPVLRDAGIGGTVSVLLHIDEAGQVLEATVDRGSTYASLDQAALAVAGVIEFSPAMNRDTRVAVRVVFPIVFRVTD